jgi:hypothetical protein
MKPFIIYILNTILITTILSCSSHKIDLVMNANQHKIIYNFPELTVKYIEDSIYDGKEYYCILTFNNYNQTGELVFIENDDYLSESDKNLILNSNRILSINNKTIPLIFIEDYLFAGFSNELIDNLKIKNCKKRVFIDIYGNISNPILSNKNFK